MMQTMFQHYFKSLALIGISILLSSCGFVGVHSEKSENVANIPPIEIAEIRSVEGSYLYDSLSKLLEHSKDSNYRIEISLDYRSSDLLISRKSDVFETKIVLVASYKLIDKRNNNVLLSNKSTVDSYYNSLYPSYSTHVSSRKLKQDLAKLSAREIHQKLMIYFMEHK